MTKLTGIRLVFHNDHVVVSGVAQSARGTRYRKGSVTLNLAHPKQKPSAVGLEAAINELTAAATGLPPATANKP